MFALEFESPVKFISIIEFQKYLFINEGGKKIVQPPFIFIPLEWE